MTITTAVPIIKVAPYAPLTLLSATSNSSVTVGTGPVTFALNEVNVGFTVGMRVHAVATSWPGNWVEGAITARSGNDITINVDLLAGTSTYTAWNLNQTGQPGTTGAVGPPGPKGDPGNPSDIVQTVTAPLQLNGTNLVVQYDTTLAVSGINALGIKINAALPGSPTTTTQAANDATTKVATTAFTQSAIAAVAAPLASPALTGTPTAPTPAPNTNTNQIATTAYCSNYQPLDADLTSLAGANTNAIYFRTAGGAWAPIVVGGGMGFDPSTGTLSSTGGASGGIPDAASNGTLYSRRNAAWIADPIQVDAPNDGNYYTRRNNAWAVGNPNYLPLAGGTMTGNLNIQTPTGAKVTGLNGTSARWDVVVDDGASETGGNAGSNFNITRYADNGTSVLGTPIAINRATGVTTIDSPNLTGITAAPTPPTADNTTKIATTAYVQAQGYMLPAQLANYLPLTGGALSGALTINNANSALVAPSGSAVFNVVSKPGGASGIAFYKTDLAHTRWGIFSTTAAESGGNAGSDFSVQSYYDSGAFLNTPLAISRSFGTVAIGPRTNGNFITYLTGGSQAAMIMDATYGFAFFGARADAGGSSYAQIFIQSGGQVAGNIIIEDAGVAYTTASDARMKRNITSFTRGREILDQLQVKDFEWSHLPDNRKAIGIIAQDARKVYPAAVALGQGEPEDKEKFRPYGIDYSKFVPLLIEALQSAHKRIDELEKRLR